MANYKVEWTVTGSYEISTSDLDLPDEASKEEVKEALMDDPFEGIELDRNTKVELNPILQP